MGCHPWQVIGEQDTPTGEGRRAEVIMAFLGAGLHDPPSRAVMVSALITRTLGSRARIKEVAAQAAQAI